MTINPTARTSKMESHQMTKEGTSNTNLTSKTIKTADQHHQRRRLKL